MPEVNHLIGKHLFPSVGSNIWFAEVLILCVPCVVCLKLLGWIFKAPLFELNKSG